MASLNYNSLLNDLVRGNLAFQSDTFKCMLVTSAYTPDKDTHAKRSNVTNEVVGAGYTSGGTTVTASINLDTAQDRLDITFSNPSWPAATITARGAVVYKSRGGASSADELVGYIDFGSDIASTGGTFAVTFNSPFRIQN